VKSFLVVILYLTHSVPSPMVYVKVSVQTTDSTRWHIYQMHSKHIFYNKFKIEKYITTKERGKNILLLKKEAL